MSRGLGPLSLGPVWRGTAGDSPILSRVGSRVGDRAGLCTELNAPFATHIPKAGGTFWLQFELLPFELLPFEPVQRVFRPGWDRKKPGL
jgi:hypothetical protein